MKKEKNEDEEIVYYNEWKKTVFKLVPITQLFLIDTKQ